jgi:PAS domain S-box-containing protein
MHGLFKLWDRMPIRRKLAVTVAFQSLALLFLTFSILFDLGKRWETDEVGETLQVRTNYLTSMLDPIVTHAITPGQPLDPELHDAVEATLLAVLKQDPQIHQITLYGRTVRRDGFYPLAASSITADTAAAYQSALLDATNPNLFLAVQKSVVDESWHSRGSQEMFSAYAPIRNNRGQTEAVLAVDMPRHELLRRTGYFKPVFTVMLSAGALLSVLLANLFSRLFTRPIDQLVKATETLGKGDFDVKVQVQTEDELGTLSESFNRMAATLRKHQADLQSNNRQLDMLNRQLRDTMVELEQANSDLSQSRNFLSTLIERTPSPIVVAEPENKILLFNEAAQTLFGWSADEIIGENFDRIYSQDNRPEIRAQLDMEIRRGKVWTGEFLGRTKDGNDRLLEVTVSPVRDDHGSILAYMYLAQDVTETRQLQNLIIQMERLSTRGEMAGEIAHEINNYLTILGGNIDLIPMLLAAGNHEKLEKKLASMKDVLEKIARFSDGLMGHNETETRRSECDLNRLVDSLAAFLKPQNRYDGIHLQLNLDENLPSLWVDVGQVQQVLVNLLNNAADSIRGAQKTDGKIDVSTEWLDNDGEVNIRITDNGAGIPANVVAKLFRERYTSKKRGHGYGLLTCRKIIEGHGGRLEAESKEGHGATFTVTIPLAAAAEDAGPQTASTSTVGRAPLAVL